MDEWKIVEHQGVEFIVSNTGRVKLAARTQQMTRVRNGIKQTFDKSVAESEYTPQLTAGGYQNIELRINGQRVRVGLHRLVAKAFCKGYDESLSVNHINGKKTDNRADNLEWVSLARNTQHAWETGLVDLRGELQPSAKLTTKRVAYIRKLIHMGISLHTIAIVADVSDSLIYLIRDGKRWASTINSSED